MPHKIIIDTDPGVDDTMAIFLALCSPELQVIGLTTIFGNVHTEVATSNALRLLEIAGRTDIPVAPGSADPIATRYPGPVPQIHGEDGQGNLFLPPPSTRPLAQSAAQFIVEQVMAQPGQITLVPVGPLTNLALALRLEPRIVEAVRGVVLMGGNAFCPGNVSPAAEANIYNDPEAADLVFGAAWPVTMVGLDVTLKVNMTGSHLQVYGQSRSPLAQHVARIVPHYRKFYEVAYPIDGICVHDSSAISYVLDPSLFQTVRHPVRVDTTHGLSRGKTWAARGPVLEQPEWQRRPAVTICTEVKAEALIDLSLSRLQ